MAIAYDTAATPVSSGTAATTLETASFAISSGSDRVLIVGVVNSANTPVNPTAVKWGGSSGTSLTQIGTTATSTYGKASLWQLVAPTAQTSTVHVTWGSAQDERQLFALVYTGVDQTTPARTPVVAYANTVTTSPTADATSSANDVVVGVLGVINAGAGSPTITVGANQTARGEIEGGVPNQYVAAGMSEETATGSSVTMSWTTNTGSSPIDWHLVAAALIPAAASNVTITPNAGGTVITGYAPTITDSLQRARPASDVTAQWTPSTGTDHYALIDEVAASDADFIYATAADQTDEVMLQAMSAPEAGTNITVNYRITGIDGGGKVTVSLRHGASAIKTDTQRTANGDYTMTVSSAEWASVTNWADMRLRFVSGA